MTVAELGDRVRIVITDLTVGNGYADREGTCYGFTTPSVTGIEVVGDDASDLALNVGFDDGETVWFAPHLVLLVDHGEGAVAVIGNKRFVRDAQGSWIEAPPDAN